MPDHRIHRGPHPEDARLFDPQVQPRLHAAACEFCWLLDHGYAHDSSLKLVGDRHDLAARQRTAVSRCCCSVAEAAARRNRQVTAERLRNAILWLDGYNVLTTIEAALAGGVILAARDGAYRDMASMHGSYRKVAETLPALELLGNAMASYGLAECRWFLDRPVSNSGRLKALMEDLAAQGGWRWHVELVPNPDTILINPAAAIKELAAKPTPEPPVEEPAALISQPNIIVATADSAILDGPQPWFNLARETVTQNIPTAWIIDLSS